MSWNNWDKMAYITLALKHLFFGLAVYLSWSVVAYVRQRF